jgi:hypothetical protein
MNIYTIALIATTVFGTYAADNKCYVCNYVKGGGTEVGDSYCKSPSDPSQGKKCDAGNKYCMKMFAQQDDLYYVQRLCSGVCAEGETDVSVGGKNIKVKVACCEGDLCNQGSQVAISTISMITMSLFTLCVLYLF